MGTKGKRWQKKATKSNTDRERNELLELKDEAARPTGSESHRRRTEDDGPE